ncbi:MAG: leucine--tRNA ligase [Bacteroidetes bacterium]|nr:leucine--tRNA ligase [Bacteroidota bacterium]
MSQYDFIEIEKKWRQFWLDKGIYKVENDSPKPKYYVLDMFPYPSGAGLHVGHPLGYIASDIVARYKRLNGFNVLHPMGYDAFGLPAEQYAIQTGQHPSITTENNIQTFRRQLDQMGFSFDWSREVRTSDPNYYRWTQWIFGLFFTHWYNKKTNRAESIETLIAHFETAGNVNLDAASSDILIFSAEDWQNADAQKRDHILNDYRLAFMDETTVNWCEALGTVLANEEVVNGVSERGGYPVVRKKMKQWALRITAYADRLLEGLNTIDWTDSIKEIQRNWIGKSEGAEIDFTVAESELKIPIFTTRPDTIFGATFMVLAPEYEGLEILCSDDRKNAVMEYANKAKNRSEIERMADTKKTGVFTGAFATNPFTKKPIPVWVSDYVLAGYGTGAIMAVPAHDERDFEFAKAFDLEIIPVIKPINEEIIEPLSEAFSAKDGICFNSGFLNGLSVKDAVKRAIEEVEKSGIGKKKINYKLREAGFGRQRYWGEPFPIIFENGIPKLVKELPVILPEVESYKPSGTGESPLAAVTNWVHTPEGKRETDTMPGWAGSSWYFLRYMDPENSNAIADKTALNYWNQVDLYVGGSEHATGHLLYSRFWTKFLFDLGIISWDEPFKKLVNQGMIQGIGELLPRYTLEDNSMNMAGSSRIEYENSGEDRILRNLYIEDQSLNQFIPQNIMLPRNRNVEEDKVFWHVYVSEDIANSLNLTGFAKYRIESNFVENDFLDIPQAILTSKKLINSEFGFNIFVCSDGVWINNKFYGKIENAVGNFKTISEVEKMSKSKDNVITPDDVISKYGADSLRLYEMFLGPLTDSKPWNTHGIEGVSRFLGKFWRLFFDGENFAVNEEKATAEELKILHKTIKKVSWDIDNMSFNTSVSAFMVATNELGQLKCKKREILEPLLILLAPFAPHITEELWDLLHQANIQASHLPQGEGLGSIHLQSWPALDEKYLVENSFSYPISINGKTRTQLEFPLDMETAEIEKQVLSDETVLKWIDGKPLKKIIIVKGRIVNVVV